MEALGGAASVIAVIDISAKILSLCGQYISAVKNAKEDIERLSREVAAIQDVLNRVKELSHGRDAAKLPTLAGLTKEIDRLSSELVDLEGRLAPGKGRRFMKRLGMQDLKWPLKRGEVDRFITALERHKTTINLALNTDQRLETKRNFTSYCNAG
jgi:polyhydroxyalkanoate synthesis regulator phasin